MAKKVNKVVFGSSTIMDISDSTAVANDVAKGKTLYLANGQKATGTLVVSSTGQTGSSDIYLVMNGDYVFKTSGNGEVTFGPKTS